MRWTLIPALCLTLAGCKAENICAIEPDQELRVKLFESCLTALPAGPTETHYNDWSEAVDSCQSAAYYHSQRKFCGTESGFDQKPVTATREGN